MIGNNACGSRALGYGRTSDNVARPGRADRGRRPAPARRPAPDGSRLLGELRRPGGRAPGHRPHRARPVRPPGVRLQPRAPAAGERLRRRQAPGRQRGHPRRWRSARRVRLVARRPGPGAGGAGLPVDGRGRRCGAGDPAAHRPVACEGLDARIVDVRPQPPRRGRRCRRCRAAQAGCWSSSVGDDPGRGAARPPARSSPTPPRWTPRWSTTPRHAAALWRIREDGAGPGRRGPRPATRRTPAGRTPRCRPSGSATTFASSTR